MLTFKISLFRGDKIPRSERLIFNINAVPAIQELTFSCFLSIFDKKNKAADEKSVSSLIFYNS